MGLFLQGVEAETIVARWQSTNWCFWLWICDCRRPTCRPGRA